MLASNSVLADDSIINDISITVPVSCNLNNTIDTPRTATINNGTFVEDIGTTTFKVFCNDNDGFSVYAIGYSNNEYGNTKMLATVNNILSPTDDILTGLTTGSSSSDASSWAMKLIKVPGTYEPQILSAPNEPGGADASFEDYHTIPTAYTKIATLPSNTDFTSGSSFKTTYRTYITKNQPAGTYQGKVRYTLVHPASAIPNQPVATPANKIGYVPNANGLVIDTMADQEYTGYTSTVDNFTTPLTPGSEATLWASNFKRPGYGFAGWSTTYDYSDPNGFYGPNQTITTPTNLDQEGLTLYAIWIKSRGELQNWTGCPSMNIGDITALTDTRDNNTYAIAKLADNKCWMIENLRLGGNTPITLTPNDSNVYSDFTLSASQDPTQSAWCSTHDAACVNQSMLYSGNTTNPVANMVAPETDGVYSYGNYYNWYSVTAGSGTYSMTSGSATSSICPKGWKLPSGGASDNAANSDFWKLSRAIIGSDPADSVSYEDVNASNAVRSYPNNMGYAGMIYYGDSFSGRYITGAYSSSTVVSGQPYAMLFSYQLVRPGTNPNGKKSYGMPARCLFEPPVTISDAYAKSGKTTHNGYYKMQDMNDSICGMVNVLDEPGQTQLIDTRDNKTYWATKLQDGHCWMTQNLDLSLSTSTALTNADTDLNTVASWTPMRSTINAVTNESTAGSIQGWTNDNNTPYSVDTGDYYWKNTPFYNSGLCRKIVGGVDYQGCNYVTKADADWKNYFSTTPYQSNGTHGHVGNHYNWSAAVASNNTSAYTTNTLANIANNPPNSICPKGWRLPTITSASPYYTQANSRDEFSRLAYLYDNYTSNTSISSEGLEKAPLYMPRPGDVKAGVLRFAGYHELYWSSTVSSGTIARGL